MSEEKSVSLDAQLLVAKGAARPASGLGLARGEFDDEDEVQLTTSPRTPPASALVDQEMSEAASLAIGGFAGKTGKKSKLDPAAKLEASIAASPPPPPTDVPVETSNDGGVDRLLGNVELRPAIVAGGFIVLLAVMVGIGYGVANFARPETSQTAVSPPATTTHFVQIGALATEERAQTFRQSVLEQYAELFAGQSLTTEPVELDGTTFYRVLTDAFADFDGAEGFCRQARPLGIVCVVTNP